MKTIALAIALLAALAAAAFAWQRNQAFETAQAALADANGQLEKMRGELKLARAAVEPLRKEADQWKGTAEQQRSELATAKAFLETERASAMRVREELTTAREQMAFILKSRASQSSPAFSAPVMVRPQTPPPAVRAAPSPAPQGNAVRAQ